MEMRKWIYLFRVCQVTPLYTTHRKMTVPESFIEKLAGWD